MTMSYGFAMPDGEANGQVKKCKLGISTGDSLKDPIRNDTQVLSISPLSNLTAQLSFPCRLHRPASFRPLLGILRLSRFSSGPTMRKVINSLRNRLRHRSSNYLHYGRSSHLRCTPVAFDCIYQIRLVANVAVAQFSEAVIRNVILFGCGHFVQSFSVRS